MRSGAVPRRCQQVREGVPADTARSHWCCRRCCGRCGGGLPGPALYDTWRDRDDPDGAPLTSCTIITGAATEGLAWLHHRTPLALLPAYEECWLDPDLTDPGEIILLLKPYPDDQLDVAAA